MSESLPSDLDIQLQREKVDQVRRKAESSDALPTKDDFVIIDGKYRFVRPYYYEFVFGVKQRYHGQNILDIFCQEFPARTREYYEHAILTGILRVENMPNLTPTTPLTCGFRMLHLVHRHEPPVLANPVTVVGTTSDYVAVNKPASMLVHVAGQYRKNTVMGILAAERPDLGELLPVHRLDKPVSGVLIFAKTAVAADVLRVGIADKGSVEKIYIARVAGVFPKSAEGRVFGLAGVEKKENREWVSVDVPLAWDDKAGHSFPMPGAIAREDEQEEAATAVPETAQVDAEVEDREQEEEAVIADQGEGTQLSRRQLRRIRKKKKINPIPKAERIAAFHSAAIAAATRKPQPRSAVTEFRLLAVAPDGLTSLVECRPLTGRSHQIRAHLGYVGHPIANDRQYGGQYDGPASIKILAKENGIGWDSEVGRTGVVRSNSNSSLDKTQTTSGGGDAYIKNRSAAQNGQLNCNNPTENQIESNIENNYRQQEQKMSIIHTSEGISSDYEISEEIRDAYCPHCPYYCPTNYPADLRPLWLHARRYASPEWVFEAPLPDWADQEWVPPLPTLAPNQ